MAMTRNRLFILPVALLLLMSCDDTFNPVEDFEPALVIYSVLDPTTDTQYVRLSMSYDPPDHIPANQSTDSAIAGAVVTIFENNGVVILQPTFVPRWSNDRYSVSIPAFVAPGFRPQQGTSYTLHVSSSLGDAMATTTIPTSSYVFTPDGVVLLSPAAYPPSEEISFNSILSSLTFAWFIRLYLDYEVAIPGGWEQHSIEIPRTLLRDDTLSTYIGTYPQLRKRTIQVASGAPHREIFYAGPFNRMVQLLRKAYPGPGEIRFHRARAILYQTDEAFYRYVKTVNGFADQFSIRTDEPDESNIAGGRGLFSSVGIDTITVVLPPALGR